MSVRRGTVPQRGTVVRTDVVVPAGVAETFISAIMIFPPIQSRPVAWSLIVYPGGWSLSSWVRLRADKQYPFSSADERLCSPCPDDARRISGRVFKIHMQNAAAMGFARLLQLHAIKCVKQTLRAVNNFFPRR